MRKIAVLGSINMDLVVRTPRVPERGETISGFDFRTIPGGKGSNQAVAAARQGARVSIVGCLGSDAFGRQMLESLRREGIDTSCVVVDADTPTGVAFVAVEESGDNRIILVPGANGLVTRQMVDAAGDAFSGAAALVLQLEIPMPAVERGARMARDRSIPVILNAAPMQPLEHDLLALVDYLVLNQVEATSLIGLPVTESLEAATTLRELGARNVIVTLGQAGTLLLGEGEPITVPGFQVKVVDTTAAGDAFLGTFAAALTEGMDLWEAVLRGNAAGALAVTKLGAQPSLPTRAETEDFLKKNRQTTRT